MSRNLLLSLPQLPKPRVRYFAPPNIALPFRRTNGFAAYSFVFWFNHATDVFSAMLAFPSENQVFAIHFCFFEKDCYTAETSAAENIVENLLLGPFGYFIPPASRFWRESISVLHPFYHLCPSPMYDAISRTTGTELIRQTLRASRRIQRIFIKSLF